MYTHLRRAQTASSRVRCTSLAGRRTCFTFRSTSYGTRASQPEPARLATHARRLSSPPSLPSLDRARGEEKARRGVREMMGTIIHDLRYTFRTLARAPAFVMVAVLTLGLGIGANTAIFSVVDAVLVRPMPYADA